MLIARETASAAVNELPASNGGPAQAVKSEPVAVIEAAVNDDSEPANWPDESAESAFLSEARERGETVTPAKAKVEIADETDAKALPSLDELVQRIPPEIRETLDDLFRAKFTKVKRIPAKALKG